MDFVTLLGQSSPLRQACVQDNESVLCDLRLVSKDASRFALLALNTYTLRLKGDSQGTNVGGARLLRQIQLRDVNVHLLLSGGWLWILCGVRQNRSGLFQHWCVSAEGSEIDGLAHTQLVRTRRSITFLCTQRCLVLVLQRYSHA